MSKKLNEYIEQADTDPGTIEVSAEGGLDVTKQPINLQAVPLEPKVEKPIREAKSNLSGITHSALDTGQLGTKWYNFKTIEIRGDPTFTWTDLIIDPYGAVTLRKAGESISLPWRRNVWSTGSVEPGYIVQLVVQANVPRPPQISGILEVIDSSRASSRYLVSFGTRVEIPIMIANLTGAYTSTSKPRSWTNPWVKTDNSANVLRYRLITINRTADISNIHVSIQLRAGYSRFNVPRKPLSSGNTNLDDLIETLRVVTVDKKRWSEWARQANSRLTPNPSSIVKKEENTQASSTQAKTYKGQEVSQNKKYYFDKRTNTWLDLPDQWESQADFNQSGLPEQSDFVTPYVGECPEEYAVQDNIGEEEEINLDAFPILIYNGKIDVKDGESNIIKIVLNLPTIPDQFDMAGENPITQKFERFANIIPTGKGAFGPVIGTYTTNFRLPTTAAGMVEHVCIPGDMNDEAAIRLFGLSSLMSLAGTAFSAIGGPLINGLVNTAAPLISGVANAVGGKAAGTLADLAINSVKGIASTVTPTEAQASNQGAAPNSIAGDIPVSRYIQFVKYVKDNYKNDPVFPTLLIKLRQFYEDGKLKTGSIPLSIFASMKNCVKIERNIFDRSVFPLVDDHDEDLRVDLDRIPYILETFIRNEHTFKKNSRQSLNFLKFLTLIDEQINTNLSTKGVLNISKVLNIKDDLVKDQDPNEFFRNTKLYKYTKVNAKSISNDMPY